MINQPEQGLKYRKRPVDIWAFQWSDNEPWSKLQAFTNHLVRQNDEGNKFHVYDRLHDTWVEFEYDDYIIKGVQGEFYPCKKDIFRQTYDKSASTFRGNTTTLEYAMPTTSNQ